MFKAFQKNAKKMVKKAAGIGLGVLFAVNASLTTAHALSAADIIESTGRHDPVAAQKLEDHIKKATGGMPFAMVDKNKIKIPDELAKQKGTGSELAPIREKIIDSIKDQLLTQLSKDTSATEDVIQATKDFNIRAIEDRFVVYDNTTNSYATSPLFSPFLQHVGPERRDVLPPAALLFLELGNNKYMDIIMSSDSMKRIDSKETRFLQQIFTTVHEARHAAQARELIASTDLVLKARFLKNPNIWPEPSKEEITESENASDSAVRTIEAEADQAGMRAVLDIAKNKEMAVDYLKGWCGYRVEEMVLRGSSADHDTVTTLTQGIHAQDPTYPVLPAMEIEIMREAIADARQAHNKALASGSNQPAAAFATSEEGRTLTRILSIAKDGADPLLKMTNVQALASLAPAKEVEAPARGTDGLKPKPSRRDNSPS